MDIELVDVAVSGSRCRGLEQENSDLDVVVEYRGGETEDSLFNTFNEDGLSIGGVKVDINPITEGKTGTLGQYLPGVEAYLAEKRAALQERNTEQAQEEKQTVITLTVACLLYTSRCVQETVWMMSRGMTGNRRKWTQRKWGMMRKLWQMRLSDRSLTGQYRKK